jgi:hypothetical protein
MGEKTPPRIVASIAQIKADVNEVKRRNQNKIAGQGRPAIFGFFQ